MHFLQKEQLSCIYENQVYSKIAISKAFEKTDIDWIFVVGSHNEFLGAINLDDFSAYDELQIEHFCYVESKNEITEEILIKNFGMAPVIIDGVFKGIYIKESKLNNRESERIIKSINNLNDNEVQLVCDVLLNEFSKDFLICCSSMDVIRCLRKKLKYPKIIKYVNDFYNIKEDESVFFLLFKDYKLYRKNGNIKVSKCLLLVHILQHIKNKLFFEKEYKKLVQQLYELDINFLFVKIPTIEELQNVPVAIQERVLGYGEVSEKIIRRIAGVESQYDIEATYEQRTACKVINNGLFNQLSEWKSSTYNVVSGKRITIGNNIARDKSIYIFGPCTTRGAFVSDEHTISSILQGKVLEMDYNVYNCGVGGGSDLINTFKYITATSLQQGDFVVVIEETKYFDDYIFKINNMNFLNMAAYFNEHVKVNDWFLDSPAHCNVFANRIFAEAIYEKIWNIYNNFEHEKPKLASYIFGKKVFDGNKELIKYLDKIAINKFRINSDDVVGALEMNLNPMTNGHKKLIDYALTQVDYLYIFVVSEMDIDIPFEVRIDMIKSEYGNYKNIKIFPCGKFMASIETFPEYFNKEGNNLTTVNPFLDILTFAQHVAPLLGITKRFVGEELRDFVTKQYNVQLSKILPLYGIELVEVPRFKNDAGDSISAYNIRKLIKNQKWDSIVADMPKNAFDVLKKYYSID